MKRIGEVTNFNGRFGIIMTDQENYDFHVSDLSSLQDKMDLKKGSSVVFRGEQRPYRINIARNIKVLEKNRNEKFTN